MRFEYLDDEEAVRSARQIAIRALNYDADLLIACRQLADLRSNLPSIGDDIFDTFVGVASETDGIPLGNERQAWNAEALKIKDKEAESLRIDFRSAVRESLLKLIESLDKKYEKNNCH